MLTAREQLSCVKVAVIMQLIQQSTYSHWLSDWEWLAAVEPM